LKNMNMHLFMFYMKIVLSSQKCTYRQWDGCWYFLILFYILLRKTELPHFTSEI
jgi:hypothetical protein